jgi:hypothetical protein
VRGEDAADVTEGDVTTAQGAVVEVDVERSGAP